MEPGLKQISMKKILSKISLVALMLSLMPTLTANAANGITLTPDSGSAVNNITTVAWTGSGYATGTAITISVDQSATLTATSGPLGDGNVTVSNNNTATITLTADDSISAAALTFDVTINLPDATPRNYSVSLASSNPVDVGAALFYAYGGNEVTVTANVPATLSFAIRTAADDANTNACALGTLTTAASSTCSYRLRISTNAAGGFVTTIAADADLNSNGNATITQVGDNVASAPNSEQYGIEVYGASAGGRVGPLYTGAVTEESPANFTFDTDTSPVPTSTQNFISYTDAFDAGGAPSLTNTTLVKHFANISGGTPAGAYSQVVTYTVTASY
jgi:hypothetical protein